MCHTYILHHRRSPTMSLLQGKEHLCTEKAAQPQWCERLASGGLGIVRFSTKPAELVLKTSGHSKPHVSTVTTCRAAHRHKKTEM